MNSSTGSDPGVVANREGFASSIAGSATGAALGLALTTPLGPEAATMIAATSGPVFTALAQSGHRRLERRWQLVSDTLRRTGKTEQELADWAASDSSRADLLYAAVAAAHDTGDSVSEKVRAMARALAEGVLADDVAVLDHSALVIQALEVIERAHLVALRGLVEEESEAGEWRHLVLSWDEWLANVPYPSSTMTRIESALTGGGLLEVYTYAVDDVEDPQLPNDAHQGKYYAVSVFGFDILRKLHDVWSDDTTPA